jgi:uncharacterized protein YfaT (DUF1175 family)
VWRAAPELRARSSAYRKLDRWLTASERTIALVERCRPLNLVTERTRIEQAWHRGERAEPRFRYALAPCLGQLRRALDQLAHALESGDPMDRLYAARVRELGLEAWVAEAIGGPGLSTRAQQRFQVDPGSHGRRAEAWARSWTARALQLRAQSRSRSDDERDPTSLVSALRRTIHEQRLPFRVELRPELLAVAATGDGVIAVRTGIGLTEQEVARIVIHELEGHAWPRWRAQQQALGLVRTGTAGAADAEEGRALLLERRHGYLDRERRAELGWRHLAALAVRERAEFVDTVDSLRRLGAPLTQALDITIRCFRGGGLGREVVYLTNLSRVIEALAQDPRLELWLVHGCVGIQASRVLWEQYGPPLLGTGVCENRGACNGGER